jgi:hypothetical protein
MDTCRPAQTPFLAGDQPPPIRPDAREPDPETKFIYPRMICSLMAIERFWASPTPIGGESSQIAEPDQDMYLLLSSQRPSLH